jgi:predicted metalloprotease with PDZ domain
MQKILIVISTVCFLFCNSASLAGNNNANVSYEINLLNTQDDLFHVTVYTEGLTGENNIYNLPSTVPGTYSLLDFGRFVKSFEAFDEDGNELAVDHITTNQWEISDVDKLAKLVYKIEDTFDTDISDNKVIPMGGTSIDKNYVVLNTFGVLGYFEGLQSIPVKLKLDYDPEWKIGTSLTKDSDGSYSAETYDRFADSPILMGNITTAKTTVNDIQVGVYVYSPDTSLNANRILNIADDVLQAAAKFIGYSPVTHYNYLMCFLDQESFQKVGFLGAGALEHSYSSLFVYPANLGNTKNVQDDMSHEFMHILTPLNLHSNVIEPFNFETPTAPEHLWLYEGVTEWESDILQLRGGLISVDDYLKTLSGKISFSDHFRQDISLTELSENVYAEDIMQQFLNFYYKGAVVAALLDIRLLELSNEKRGLRDVLIDLLKKFGKNKPFRKDEFFDIFVDNTYPEIREFIDDYIKGTKPLPYKEYLAKLGFNYTDEKPSGDTRPSLGVQMGMNEQHQLTVIGMSDATKEAGLMEGDVPVKMLGTEVSMATAREIFGKINSMTIGDSANVVVKRGDEEVELNIPLQRKMDKHIFESKDNLNEDQEKLRDAWLKNL